MTTRISEWESVLLAVLGPQFWEVRVFEQVDSTMDEGRMLLSQLEPGRSGLILARQQTAGRGRHGRQWVAPPGSYLTTCVFTSSINSPVVAALPLVVGCVLAELLEGYGCSVALKWPNDILVSKGSERGKKLAGILLELVSERGMHCYLVGIGINVKQPPAQMPEATALDSCGVAGIDALDLAKRLTPKLRVAFERAMQAGFASYRAQWLERAWGLGAAVTVQSGLETVEGVFCGVNEDGHLGVRQGAHERYLPSADLVRFT